MPTSINAVIDAIETALLDAVNQDNDDILFFASYLHGHNPHPVQTSLIM